MSIQLDESRHEVTRLQSKLADASKDRVAAHPPSNYAMWGCSSEMSKLPTVRSQQVRRSFMRMGNMSTTQFVTLRPPFMLDE
eukprot:2191380-Amphidinium_carterae.1